MSPAVAAERIGVKADRLASWESGELRPTIKQLRTVANVYRQPFAAFYLATPPDIFAPPVHDYRRIARDDENRLSPELLQDLRLAMDRREILLELGGAREDDTGLLGVQPKLHRDPEGLGEEIRNKLGITPEIQRSWMDPEGREAFNRWRESIESLSVLVFQATEVGLDEMRGYSIAEYPLPIIVVNRKDTYTGRTFSMLHELTHVLLRSSGVCDLEVRYDRPTQEQKTEIYCNRVAGAALVPESWLTSSPIVQSHTGSDWSEEDLVTLGRQFGVSREVVLRRFLILGLTTNEFYEQRRKHYMEQYRRRAKEGFVAPSTNAVSAAGKPYVRAVLEAYFGDRITSSDASDYLGVRLKHIPAISQYVGLG